MIVYTDRSRIETGLSHCMRHRWWASHYRSAHHKDTDVGGISRKGFSFAPETGTAIHNGIESIIGGSSVETAVMGALTIYIARTMAHCPSEDADEDMLEKWRRELADNLAIAEALIRCWAIVQWPKDREAFETIAVEREEEARFPHIDGNWGVNEVCLMTRADWLVRRRSDGTLFIKNFKSTTEATKFWREQWRYDMQTMSEGMAVAQRLERERVVEYRRERVPVDLGVPVRIGGTIIQGLLKGRRDEWPKGSGERYYNSPLTRCWYQAGEPPMTSDDFVPLSRYEWSCTSAHKQNNGRMCPGGKNHRLGAGYRKVAVADVYPGGIKAWIGWLVENAPEVLEAQIVELPPIMRSEWEIERWKRQTLGREVETARAADAVNALEEGSMEWHERLDSAFPMTTGNACVSHFGQSCPFIDVCFGQAGDDPLSTGLFQIRVPNHPKEAEGGE